LVYAVPFLQNKIDEELTVQGDGRGKTDSWTLGFEGTIIVALNIYNGKARRESTINYPNTRYNWHYGFEVVDKTYQYEPIK